MQVKFCVSPITCFHFMDMWLIFNSKYYRKINSAYVNQQKYFYNKNILTKHFWAKLPYSWKLLLRYVYFTFKLLIKIFTDKFHG